jgi:hypothetical protein
MARVPVLSDDDRRYSVTKHLLTELSRVRGKTLKGQVVRAIRADAARFADMLVSMARASTVRTPAQAFRVVGAKRGREELEDLAKGAELFEKAVENLSATAG